ncbi:hypothetical protein [Micromonospora sp. RTGN7]|uniref:hypothetical protein n=1 Tax=Micromonospora sp. RTGN7 TaxID=3016526 RepID=UPI0029FF3BA9|nr:hypothetical protein [Micromonospora sp. RTGN7]
MKAYFTRWLPVIAKTTDRIPAVIKTPNRKTVLSIAGVAALGGLAFGPTAGAAPITSSPHAGAVAAIGLATGKARAGATTESALTTGEAAGITSVADEPDRDELIPHGIEGAQSRIPLDDAQLANAKAIIKAAKETDVGERGAVIGVATSLQESKLYNLGHLGTYNDHDSQGLFQQRPSSGWGSPDEITDPDYASKAFFNALKNVGGWHQLPLTAAAQTVQVSAYPYAYAQWEEQAADVVQQLW